MLNKNFNYYFTTIFTIFVLTVNGSVLISKVCNTKNLFQIRIKALCESESGLSISCLKNPRKAYLQCKPGYYNEQNISLQIINCMDDGEWSESHIKCIPNYIPLLEESKKTKFPTSYVNIIRKKPHKHGVNKFRGQIIHEKKILTKCNFIKENEYGDDFLIEIKRSKTKREQIDSFSHWISRFTHNNEKYCILSLKEDYIKYDSNIGPSCLFLEIIDKIEINAEDNFLSGYEKKCFEPDIDDQKAEVTCFNYKGIHHLETLSSDGKALIGGGRTSFLPHKCSERVDEVIARCQLGYENQKSNNYHYLSYCLEGNWEYHPTDSSDCKRVCGEIDPTYDPPLTPLLYKGVETNIISAPWHVAIFANNTKISDTFEQICGGSIIHSNIVISAAHCFYNDAYGNLFDPLSYLVGGGKQYRSYNVNEKMEQYKEIYSIKIPSTYRSDTLQDDIALLHLKEHFKFSSHIKPICIEWREYDSYFIKNRVVGRTFGWGSTSKDEVASNGLLTIDLLTMTNTECKKLVNPNLRSQITNDKFCATNRNNATACRGDSGGGFVIKRGLGKTGYYILAGVISVGLDVKNYCSSGFLSLFTNFLYHKDFIETAVQNIRNSDAPRRLRGSSSIAGIQLE